MNLIMKKIQSLIIVLAVLAGLQSCEKKEVVLGDFESLGVGSYLRLDSSQKTIFDYSNIANESVAISVSQYGADIDKVIVYATAGSPTLNKTLWKKVKEFPYPAGTNLKLTITAADLAAALGISTSALAPGSTYAMYNQVITKSGKTYDASNTTGALSSNPNYKASSIWSANVVCPFNPAGFTGQFEVTEDTWEDFGVGDVVDVVTAGADSIRLAAYPNPLLGGTVVRNPLGIVVKINPTNGIATVTDQTYGTYGGLFGLQSVAVTTSGTSNFVFSCVGTIDLRMTHHVPGALASSYGTYWLRLKKK